MATISLCMIVKNEEKKLAECLDSLQGLMDEIIIVDTGSTDETKAIAAGYTDKIYHFTWIGDFAAARNYAFSKAGCEYIYTADADELLDAENYEKFRRLKESLLPEVEIVQMYYGNQLSYGSVYNYDRELRPKLFKRERNFQWIDPVHETVRLLPVVFDSDIEITHRQEESHANRDLAIFETEIKKGKHLSGRLNSMYARELLMAGNQTAICQAEDYFTQIAEDEKTPSEQLKEALCIIVRAARLRGDYLKMYRYALKDVAQESVSEICYELGEYYLHQQDYTEAAVWFYNAAYETQGILNIHCNGDWALERLAECYEAMGMHEQATEYRQTAVNWNMT